MNKFEIEFSQWVLRNRIPIIIAALILVVLACGGLKNLTFTTNYRVFFSEDNPELIAFDALENTYTKSDNVLFVIAPHNGLVFTRDVLKAVEELTEEAWQTPYSSRVDSLSSYQHTEANGDDLVVRDLYEDAESLSNDEIEEIRRIALSEPLLVRSVVSDTGHVTGVNVTIQLPRVNEAEETPQVVDFVRELAADIESRYPIKIYLTGMIMMNNAFSESSQLDFKNLVPISFGLMLVLLALLVGGISGTLTTLLVIAFSILCGMGLGGYLGMPITPPSASSPTIILTVAIANCVHILVSAKHAMQTGKNKHAALSESLRINLQPVFLASVTTALGFLSMNFSDVPPFQHLGNFVAMGVITSFFLSVTMLPAILSFLPIRVREQKAREDSMMARFGDFVVNKRSPLLWCMSLVILALLCALPRNELNDIYVHYFDESISFRTDSDFTTANMTGLYTIEYSLVSDEPGGISKPDFMDDVEAFVKWYREQPETIHVFTLTDIIKRLNKNMHGDDPAKYTIPDNRELTAQYMLLYEMSLPYGLDLNDRINVDKSSTKVVVRIKTISTKQFLALDQRAQDWIRNNAPSIKSSPGTGTGMMFANIGQRNIRSMLFGTTVALIMISIILILALRSVKIGLISLIPNLAPAAMGFGLWGFLVGEIGLSLSVVSTMSLGIVIDDTVHFLSKYLRARRENNLNSPDAVRYAFRTVGRALVITSIVLAAGFFVLATSSFELNSGMGLLTAIVILFALVADFLFLPPLLMKLEEDPDEEQAMPDRITDTTSA
ncbi:MAG: MMPL family transporter [Thiotrichales bacterium]|nr:MMPL family transporter [Thiotrichales bacterium]